MGDSVDFCDTTSWRPMLVPAADEEAVAGLLESGRVWSVDDRLRDQLEELVRCREPGRERTAEELDAAVETICGDGGYQHYGTWVFYPWSGRLARMLPRAEFRQVRSDRNRDKISREAQEVLRSKTVGIVGLSVGNSAALTCAMEGVGGRFVLADFDVVGLSNLNRLRASVTDLGVPKTVLCARQMLEIDPYLEIHLVSDGLTAQTMQEFFAGPAGRLDLAVEECDTAWVKLAVREHARAMRIPVLMDTNDRGMLDIERFDLEGDRPLLHGRLGALTADDLSGLNRGQLLQAMVAMVDADGLSPAMTDALAKIGTTLSSWPQLASGVMLGGALVTDTARRILTGEPVPSGRHYVDLSQLIPAAGTACVPPQRPARPAPVTELKGAHTRLRELLPDDAAAFTRIYTSKVLTRYLGVDQMDHAQARDAFDAALAQQHASPRSRYTLAITAPDDDTMCGVIGLLVEGYGSNAMVTGLAIVPGTPVSGHASEAGRLLMAHAFGPLGLHRIWAGHRADHTHMPTIMHTAGLQHEGTLKELFRTQGRWHDVTTYAVTVDRWLATATPLERAIVNGNSHDADPVPRPRVPGIHSLAASSA
jgi:RimJ/RimL family protein N-acetyltransferase